MHGCAGVGGCESVCGQWLFGREQYQINVILKEFIKCTIFNLILKKEGGEK